MRAIPDTAGGVTLLVETSDEISLVLDAAIGAGHPFVRFFRFGDANLDGEGLYVAGDWRNGGAFRDAFGGRLVDNQMFGEPYTFSAQAYRNPLGTAWAAEGFHPFYTDIQRLAWLVQLGSLDDFVQFENDINSAHAIRLVRSFFELGGVLRIGPPGRLSLFGVAIVGDDERPGQNQVLVTSRGFALDTSTQLLNRYVDHRIARVNLLWGIRDIGFTRVKGLDALTATEDFPIGFQVGTTVRAQRRRARRARRRHLPVERPLRRRDRAQQRPPASGRGRRAPRQFEQPLGRNARQRHRDRVLQARAEQHDDAFSRVQRRLAAAHPLQLHAERPRGRRSRIFGLEHPGSAPVRGAASTPVSTWGVRTESPTSGLARSSTRAACGRATYPTASTPRRVRRWA